MKILCKKILALLIVFSIMPGYSFGADKNIENNNAQALVSLGIMKGYEDGTLRLENSIKRSEFITLIVNLLGYEKDNDIENIKITYTDITKNHWAYNHLKRSIKYDLVSGYPDNTVRPNKDVTYAESVALIIRALGYEKTLEGKWPENVTNKANNLGLDKNLKLDPNHKLTRGEMSIIIYNSLTVKFNNQ